MPLPRLHPRQRAHRTLGLATWMALTIAGASGSALAVTLGPVSVESGIGQPLRAAIEITQYKVEDLRKLTVQLAPAASFEQAQMAFHPALNGLQTRLEFRGDGKPFIALTGLTPVNEHFIDVIVEAQWPSGRLAMNYTLLVSPVGAHSARPAQTPPPTSAQDRPIEPVVFSPSSVGNNPNALATITVQAGDTASRLVLPTMPANVTLDQMLLAMVRGNPEAFIEGNVNLLREGAQVQLPSAQEAEQISAEEARQTVVAQTVDFVAYTRRLAQAALKVPDSSTRELSSPIRANSPATTKLAPQQDTLKLSKREGDAHNDEARLAVEREIQDKTEQLTTLKKNLETLKSLSAPPSASADKAHTAGPAEPQRAAPNLPTTVEPASAQSLLAHISRSPSIWAWVLALLCGMLVWVWLARRRPAGDKDLFAPSQGLETDREGSFAWTSDQAAEPNAEHMPARAPLPSGLPPQFANLDLNLTPATDPRAAPAPSPTKGPNT